MGDGPDTSLDSAAKAAISRGEISPANTAISPANTAVSPANTAIAPARRRAQFHNLQIAEVRRLTDNSIEVTFHVPDSLAHAYDYEPGQYVAIRTTLEGEDLRRSYSICQAPRPGVLKVAIKRGQGGTFSTWALANLKPGMDLEVMSPEGKFTSQFLLERRAHYVAIAAGSGITPVIALIQSALEADDGNRFSLIYSNSTAMDTMFVDDLADLKDRYPARLALYHVLTRERRSSELLTGRLDADKLERILGSLVRPSDVDEWFLCGPFELVQLCRDTLAAKGVPAEEVRYELFTTGEPGKSQSQHGRPVEIAEGQKVCEITFRLDGTTSTVSSPSGSGETVLNAALRVRGDVPFACAGGVCGTCRAVLTDGAVRMAENFALEPDELERGYVLTCQSVPTSEKIAVDYDT